MSRDRRSRGSLGQLLFEFLERFAGLAHGVDLFLHLARALGDPFVGDLLVVEDDELADRPFAVAEVIAEEDDLLGDERGARDRLDHRQLAALDAPRDFDFAFAREQWNRAHLAQVHPDRVVCLVERAGREIELEFFRALGRAVDGLLVAQVLLVRVDDLDAGAAERVEQVVELVGRGDFRRKELVHLVVQQVALFLADVDELPYFVVFLFNRHSESFKTIPRSDASGLSSSARALRFPARA